MAADTHWWCKLFDGWFTTDAFNGFGSGYGDYYGSGGHRSGNGYGGGGYGYNGNGYGCGSGYSDGNGMGRQTYGR